MHAFDDVAEAHKKMQDVVARISFGAGLSDWCPAIRVVAERPCITVIVTALVPDRDDRKTRTPTRVRESMVAAGVMATHPNELVRWVQCIMKRFVMHEFDESFRVDGELYIDPHKGEFLD